MKQSEIDELKTELINDLVATTTVIEEVWRYHPINPDKKDVEEEYNILRQIAKDIEIELEKLENIRK
jgi:hypothetical protein